MKVKFQQTAEAFHSCHAAIELNFKSFEDKKKVVGYL